MGGRILNIRGEYMSKLTAKQQRFADEYLKTLNATQAAKNAGYSEKTAYSIGHRLMHNENVAEYIKEQKDKIMDENILDAKELLYLLSRAATGEETESREMLVKTGIMYLIQTMTAITSSIMNV